MTTPARRGPELPALTAVRFFAAIVVVAHHYAPPPGLPSAWPVRSWLQHGFVGVSLFFVLSGFVLRYTYAPRSVADTASRKRFWWARLARIYPMHLVGLALCAPMIIAARLAKDGLQLGLVKTAIALTVNLTMLGAWLQLAANGWNDPSWSLSAEAFFYACFPFVLARIGGLSRRGLLGVDLAVYAVGMTLPFVFALRAALAPGDLAPAAGVAGLSANLPLFHLHEFVLGMLLCLLRPQLDVAWWSARGRSIAAASVVVVAVILAFPLRHALLPLAEGLLAPLFALAILGYSFIPTAEVGWFGSKTMRLLGGASFSVYILQQPVFLVLLPACARLGLASPLLAFGLVTTALVVLSCFAFQYIEEPMRRRILGARAVTPLKVSAP